MENTVKIISPALALAVSLALVGCTATPIRQPAPIAQRPPKMSITQVGFGRAARYVYCVEKACPLPSRKTPVSAVALARTPPALREVQGGVHSIDVSFPVNSSRMSESERTRLIRAVSVNAGARVEIIARSDFSGAHGVQLQLAQARAAAMRFVVAKQAQGVQIVNHQEITTPDRVPGSQRAYQRKGMVNFSSPTNVPMKGSLK